MILLVFQDSLSKRGFEVQDIHDQRFLRVWLMKLT
jgi:hypothetical protein